MKYSIFFNESYLKFTFLKSFKVLLPNIQCLRSEKGCKGDYKHKISKLKSFVNSFALGNIGKMFILCSNLIQEKGI